MQIHELNWVYLAKNLSFMPVRLRNNEALSYFNFSMLGTIVLASRENSTWYFRLLFSH